MKRIINLFLFFLAISISSIVNSTLTQKMNRIDLAGILSLNQASAEDGPVYTVAYSNVKCDKSTITNPDGTQTVKHELTCYGLGSLECKCIGHPQ